MKNWNDMSTAPKDKPILAIHKSECGDPRCAFHTGEGSTLCMYHGHAEGLGSAADGPCIIEWGGGWNDNTYEYSGGWMPDWWFRYGSEFEEAANPIGWLPIPEAE